MNISIITINRNNANGLENTIKSVMCQKHIDIEYIVIDGNSTDGSISVIEKYKKSLSFVVSEPDTGIYNAMNKGIKKATGDYLLFLNSGDILFSDTALSEVLSTPMSEDIIYCDLIFVSANKEVRSDYPGKLNFSFFVNNSLPHPATFFKRNCFERLGYYDEDLKIASDWKFGLLAICKYNLSYEYRKIIISKFYEDGISSDPRHATVTLQERQSTLLKNFPMFIEDYKRLSNLEEKYKILIQWKQNPRALLNFILSGLANKFKKNKHEE